MPHKCERCGGNLVRRPTLVREPLMLECLFCGREHEESELDREARLVKVGKAPARKRKLKPFPASLVRPTT